MTNTQTDETMVAELLKLEEERCRAFRELDEGAMQALLSPDYTHVHMSGHLDDKAAFMEGFKNRPQHGVSRGSLMVRIHGDAAIMTGRTYTTRQTDKGVEDLGGFATQTWIRQDGSWRLAAMQVCPYSE
jgi:hypothetical protein